MTETILPLPTTETLSFCPLYTYTLDEVAALMHCSRQRVSMWMEAGILAGIKTGKGTVITSTALLRFQETYEGYDVSNLVSALDAKKKVEKENEQKGNKVAERTH